MDLVPYREQMGAGLWNAADNTGQVIVQHTTESEGGNTSVIGYLERTENGSYQTMIDFDGEEVRMVPDNRQAWAAMNSGNRIGLHVCAMGRAAYGRDKWLSEAKLLERTAMRYAEWSRLYGIPLVKLTSAEVAAGKRGVCGHVDITYAFRESDHTDPGSNFPYDKVIARAKEILGGAPATEGDDDMAWLSEKFENFKGNKMSIKDLFWWVDKNTSETRDEVKALRADVAEIKAALKGGK